MGRVRAGSADRWFATADGATGLPVLIFCFPYAGADAGRYLAWQDALGTAGRLVAVRLPGRGERAGEPAPGDLAGLVDGAAAAVAEYLGCRGDPPVVLFGHSFGALLAFEVARQLAGRADVRYLVASGCAAPSGLPSEYLRWAARLDRPAFAAAAAAFGSIPPEILVDEDLQDLLLPEMAADIGLMARYEYRSAAPLPADIHLVNGRGDHYVEPAALAGWRRESRTAPVYHWADGGHFYFQRYPQAVTDVLRAVTRDITAPVDVHVEMI